MKTYCFAIILLFLKQATCHSSNSILYFQFNNIKLNAHKGFCDENNDRNEDCDMHFKLCVSSNQKSNCDIIQIETPRYAFKNKNKINFGKKIGFIPNPISNRLLEFPRSLRLSIEIFDADFSIADTDDHLATIEVQNISLIAANVLFVNKTSKSFGKQDYNLVHNITKNVNLTINISLWIICQPDLYGKYCESRCIPTHDNGHYGCRLYDGKKICMTGWGGSECDEKRMCDISSPCGPFANCWNVKNEYICICKHNFTGPNCLIPNRPCQSEFKKCENHSICYKSQTDDLMKCLCPPGFTGQRCEKDIDECKLCQNQSLKTMSNTIVIGDTNITCCDQYSECVNEFGNYRCKCTNGWSGLYCQTPPTKWPIDYQPTVNKLIYHKFKISKPVSSSIDDDNLLQRANENTKVNVEKTYPGNWPHILLAVLLILLIILLSIVIWCYCRQRRQFIESKYANTVGRSARIPNLSITNNLLEESLPSFPSYNRFKPSLSERSVKLDHLNSTEFTNTFTTFGNDHTSRCSTKIYDSIEPYDTINIYDINCPLYDNINI